MRWPRYALLLAVGAGHITASYHQRLIWNRAGQNSSSTPSTTITSKSTQTTSIPDNTALGEACEYLKPCDGGQCDLMAQFLGVTSATVYPPAPGETGKTSGYGVVTINTFIHASNLTLTGCGDNICREVYATGLPEPKTYTGRFTLEDSEKRLVLPDIGHLLPYPLDTCSYFGNAPEGSINAPVALSRVIGIATVTVPHDIGAATGIDAGAGAYLTPIAEPTQTNQPAPGQPTRPADSGPYSSGILGASSTGHDYSSQDKSSSAPQTDHQQDGSSSSPQNQHQSGSPSTAGQSIPSEQAASSPSSYICRLFKNGCSSTSPSLSSSPHNPADDHQQGPSSGSSSQQSPGDNNKSPASSSPGSTGESSTGGSEGGITGSSPASNTLSSGNTGSSTNNSPSPSSFPSQTSIRPSANESGATKGPIWSIRLRILISTAVFFF